jgi:hypothetical protein
VGASDQAEAVKAALKVRGPASGLIFGLAWYGVTAADTRGHTRTHADTTRDYRGKHFTTSPDFVELPPERLWWLLERQTERILPRYAKCSVAQPPRRGRVCPRRARVSNRVISTNRERVVTRDIPTAAARSVTYVPGPNERPSPCARNQEQRAGCGRVLGKSDGCRRGRSTGGGWV